MAGAGLSPPSMADPCPVHGGSPSPPVLGTPYPSPAASLVPLTPSAKNLINGDEHPCSVGDGFHSRLETHKPGVTLNVHAKEFVPTEHGLPGLVIGSPLGLDLGLDGVGLGAPMIIPLNPVALPTPELGELVSPPTSSMILHVSSNNGEEATEEIKVKFNPNDPKYTEVKAALLKQVEFYFSDQNFPTDSHLSKIAQRNAEGFVPLKIIAGFNRIKSIVSKEFNISMAIPLMSSALRDSSTLTLSKNGKSVKRTSSLSDVNLEDIESCTVLVENLTEAHTVEAVEKIFSSVGKIKMVRVYPPNSGNNSSQFPAKFKAKASSIISKWHALVEYSTSEDAEKAVEVFKDTGDWRNGFRVHLLKRLLGKVKTKKGNSEEGDQYDYKYSAEQQLSQPNTSQGQNENEDSSQGHRGVSGVRIRGRGRGRGSNIAPHSGGKEQHHSSSYSTPPRISLLSSSPLGSSDHHSKVPPGPRMPDGTRGFTFGRGKKLDAPISNAEVV